MAKQYHHASHSKYLLKYHFVFCCKYRKKLLRGLLAERVNYRHHKGGGFLFNQ